MSFSASITRFNEKAAKSVDKTVRQTCLKIARGVIEKTPVDDGRLRGNWQASIGSPLQSQITRTDITGAATVAASLPSIAKATGNVWYFANNLPYAAVAEFGLWGTGEFATQKTTRDGYSVQAPYGMVRLTMQELKL